MANRTYRRAKRSGQGGFAYLFVIVLVASIGIFTANHFGSWQDSSQRLKEKQLLFAGRQIRQAIIDYYEHTPEHAPKFPTSLADLLRDPRQPSTARYLREIYRDPMTGTSNWGLIKSAGGAIVGVYSRAVGHPLKGKFASVELALKDARSYAEWVFVVPPGRYTVSQPHTSEQSYVKTWGGMEKTSMILIVEDHTRLDLGMRSLIRENPMLEMVANTERCAGRHCNHTRAGVGPYFDGHLATERERHSSSHRYHEARSANLNRERYLRFSQETETLVLSR